MRDGGLLTYGGRAIFLIRHTRMKVVLELALVLLRILKEVLGLIKDIKDLRRPKKAKR